MDVSVLFRLQAALNTYYDHPRRPKDIDQIYEVHGRVEGSKTFCPSAKDFAQQTEFVLSECKY